MTDETAPAQRSLFATFEDQLRNLTAPRNWLLHAWPDAEEPSDDPTVVAPCPVPEGMQTETHLAIAGATIGRWRVQLVPTTNKAAARHRLDRLQARGPVAGVLSIEQAHIDEAREMRPARRTRGFGRPEPEPQRSASVKALRDQVELQKAENERQQLLLESKRIEMQLRDLERGQPTPPGPFAGIAQVLAPFAPIALQAFQGFIENQRRTAEAIAELANREPSIVQLPSERPQGITLESVLALVPQLKDLAKMVGGLGVLGDRDDEPKSDTLQMIETVRDLLASIRTPDQAPAVQAVPAPAIAPAAMSPALVRANGHPPRTKQRTPQEIMNFRVLGFFTAVMREQAATADPANTADRLFPTLGAMPEAFRNLMLQSENVDQLLAGLPAWLPASMRVEVPNAIRLDQKKLAWLSVFLATVREIAGQAADELEPEQDATA